MSGGPNSSPKVFVSYSHDDDSHIRWVRDLATRLCEHGVDVVIDQWSTGPGADVAKFMVDAIERADRVIIGYRNPTRKKQLHDRAV